MGGRQPYMYQPVTHAPFNPKAYSQSLANPSPPRPKPDGPLIQFNRHPDSYNNLPYGKHVNAKLMSPGSKKRILVARKIQLGWRTLQWFAALAVLACVVIIKGAPDTQGWILRLPPALDLAVSTYAVWHLCRAPTHHPPASAASYHAFSLVMDIGLIPFYAFTSILLKNQFETPADTEGRWRTMLNTTQATNTVFQVTWLTAIVAAGLHAVSLFISAYLIVMFRKIANLPPDMNPLEDNLTSRSKSKHKYKNSDLSALMGEEKRFSDITARKSNTSLSDEDNLTLRMSQTSEKLTGVDKHRSSGVSFFASRNGQANTYSPHNPETAAANQLWYIPDPNIYKEPGVVYQQTGSARHSRADSDSEYGHSRTYSPMPNAPRIAKRHSAAPASPIAIYDENHQAEEPNWEILDHDEEGNISDDFDPYRQAQSRTVGKSTGGVVTRGSSRYQQVAQSDSETGNLAHLDPSRALRMNPPTPDPVLHVEQQPTSPLARLSRGYHDDKENTGAECDERTHTITSQSSFHYSESEPTTSQVGQQEQAPPKSRFYTDLAAAMRGVRHHNPSIKVPKSVAGSVHTHLSSSTATSGSKAVPATLGDRRIKPSGTVIRKPLKSYDDGQQTGYTVAKSSPSRVVSRSGVDVDVMEFAANGDLGLGSVGKTRREVSGKVAEEGRGGGLWRRISGRVPSR
ncbi:uncharacterized protein PV09_06413 [Verruconis gallopava]|uniref:Uncharacterized protein n=1 Tax=Verruconis gallopava TaxID=253628 RepID=A0A0D2A686_9PEZI|nr:uncharacterized protein PV09_06413 [Verruconis gallopava]KIW02263.1 hypothetical protein PV09_06413 [Verruconis gallopava]